VRIRLLRPRCERVASPSELKDEAVRAGHGEACAHCKQLLLHAADCPIANAIGPGRRVTFAQ